MARPLARVLRTALASAAFAALGAASALQAGTTTVFAAASLKNAMDEIAGVYKAETGNDLLPSFAGSSKLARQIQQGAPAQIFISANPGWMDTLEQDGLLAEGSRQDLLLNSIVLIAGPGTAPDLSVTIGPDTDLAAMLGDDRLAMALVDAVPAGIYGKAALTSLGLWDAVEPKVAQADNVRAALRLVGSGEAPMGIVYATDAAADAEVRVLDTFPADSHPAIVYPAAILAEGDTVETRAAFAFLTGPEARAIFKRHGFGIAGE
ncbi:molybdate ABC transporter substrate-binding protein [Pseudodonghicola flavimaris]|uniref:Molybdate ABC transporter substrate-binding protein n=1 Tax=Pseudodonghicola flavimaris TaxID=3050036 RepID=A0ABT7EZC1_9RHOB|nr:molybdate ABC transporter substrate-binding protein [Pseudodonghicola flavimaris]MDK3017594.1 molybdate ABC transporter substrate-binding protein [Pseudodonghicola flavimaris]